MTVMKRLRQSCVCAAVVVATLIWAEVSQLPQISHHTYYPSDHDEIFPPQIRNSTEVVMFVPSPIAWEGRRQNVHTQFEKEGWAPSQAILLFIFGKSDHTQVTQHPVKYPHAANVEVNCSDFGDEFDNPADASSTT